MSHFTVLVKLSKETCQKYRQITTLLDVALAPFDENTKDPAYQKEEDMTEDVNTSAARVIEASGYLAKERPDLVGKTLLDYYEGDLDRYAAEEYGARRLPERTGYFRLRPLYPKWDWYAIGGRWRGLLPVIDGATMAGVTQPRHSDEHRPEAGYADWCLRKELDLEKMQKDEEERIQKFWEDYQEWRPLRDLGEEAITARFGPPQNRSEERARVDRLLWFFHIDVGACRMIKQRAPILDAEGKPRTYERPALFGGGTEVVPLMSDAVFEYDEITLEDLRTKYAFYFRFQTFCVLDTDGKWYEKGEMGWWGASSDGVEYRKKWGSGFFEKFLEHEDPDTLLVVVDCHI